MENLKNLKIYKAMDDKTPKKLTGYPSIDKPWEQFYTKRQQNLVLPLQTIYQYMAINSLEYPDSTAINYFGVKISYKKLLKKIDETAKALKQVGIVKNSIVTICMPNIPEAAYIFYATNKIGAIVNFVHPLSKEKDFKHYLEVAKSDKIFIFDGAYSEASKISSDLLKKMIVVSPTNAIPAPLLFIDNTVKNVQSKFNKNVKPVSNIVVPKSDRVVRWNEFIKDGNKYEGILEEPYEQNRAAVMVYTGGTTGEPKGVLLSNENYNAEVAQIACSATFKQGDVMLGITPPFISYVSCNALHMPLVLGLELAMIPEFIPSKYDEYFKKYKPQIIQGNPGYCVLLTRNDVIQRDNTKLDFLTYLVSGGDKMYRNDEEMINQFLKAHHSDIRVTKGLGQTECTSCTTFTFDQANKLESVGIPLVMTNVKIVELGTEKELGYEEQGELCISGPTVMLGYYNNESETNKAIKMHADGNVYYHTGDICRIDTDGCIFHEDRERRIILTQDEGNIPAKIFPNKVENTILKHPGVASCVTIAVPHPDRIHLPKVYLKLKKDAILDEQMIRELNDICHSELSEYMMPYDYEAVETFPLTKIGKVDYRALEEINKDNFYQKSKQYTKTIK